MKTRVAFAALMVGLLMAGCASERQSRNNRAPTTIPQPDSAPAEAVSLLGKPLFAPALPLDVEKKRQRELESAQQNYDRDPHDEQAIIWIGRRLASLGRYNGAINIFSNGVALHPESYRLLRHRGHRSITIRKFDLALADLQRAAELIENVPDETEPDGQPNKLNIPTSTSHTNIYYHLALAQYLSGDYPGAAATYQRCLDFSDNDDMRVATIYWFYLALRRSEQDEDAKRLLDSISREMNIFENASYHRLLLMFKGELQPNDVSKPGEDNQPPDIDLATTGYGIGMFYLLRGEKEKAFAQFQNVIDKTNWAAFGHIAAEAELARLSTP